MKPLRILGLDIGVEYQEDLAREFNRSGHYDSYHKRIKIGSGASAQHQNLTLLHEVLEVLDTEMQLGLDHDTQLCKLEIGLWQVFRDNPHLLDIFK